jgi:hypothetical protein
MNQNMNVNPGLTAKKRPAAPAPRKNAAGRKQKAGRKNVPVPAPAASSKKPSILSLEGIGDLRTMCKNTMKYLQQADVWLDTLYIASNNLNKTGLLKKLTETKGKGLSTTDLTGLLLSFMNTPLADQFFKGGSSSDSAAEPPDGNRPSPGNASPQPQAAAPPAMPAVPQNPNQQAPYYQAWPGYAPGYGMAPQNPVPYQSPPQAPFPPQFPGWPPPGPAQPQNLQQ